VERYLASAGFTVWGFDFVGYGVSIDRPPTPTGPLGGMDAAMVELRLCDRRNPRAQ
jgi:hypothetical protein